MLARLLTAVAAALLAVSAAPAIAQAPPPAKVVFGAKAGTAIPFSWSRGRILFDATLAGRPVVALLDSGFDSSAIDSDLAHELGLTRGAAVSMNGVTGSVGARWLADTPFGVPGVFDARASVLTFDFSTFRMGRRIDMVVGADLLRQVAVRIDFARHTLTFAPPGGKPAGFIALPMVSARPAPAITVDVAGHALTTLIDLGDAGAFSVASSLWPALRGDAGAESDAPIAGVSGKIDTIPVARIRTLRIGGLKTEAVATDIADQAAHYGFRPDAAIGTQLLERFDVVLDFGADTMWIRARTPAVAPLIDRAGLALLPADKALLVVYAAKGSPAALGGWKPGERICTINAAPIDPQSDAAFDWRYGPEGSTVVLKLCDGTERRLTLRQFY